MTAREASNHAVTFSPRELLALVQAGLAITYFMHMKMERRSLALFLLPATVFVLAMMNMIWSDSFRLLHMRPFAH